MIRRRHFKIAQLNWWCQSLSYAQKKCGPDCLHGAEHEEMRGHKRTDDLGSGPSVKPWERYVVLQGANTWSGGWGGW